MVDKVKPLKIESTTSGGTQNDVYPTEVNTSQDYLSGKGVAIEGLDTYLIDKSGSTIQFTDPTSGARTLQSLHTANNESYDNVSSGLIASNTQSAIDELSTKLNKTRFTIVCTFNGSISNNNWLGYSEVIPGNQVPIRIPMSCILREISFSYSQANILGIPTSGDQVDGQFQLYKNGLVDPTNVITTITFTNQAGGKLVTGLNLSIAANDYIVGKWLDQGDNPSDLAIVYFFEVP